MKQAYTIYNSGLSKQAKKFGMSPKGLLDQAYWGLHQLARSGANVGGELVADQALLNLEMASIEYQIIQNRAVHIFISDIGFAEWLVGCVRNIEPSHIKILQDEIGLLRVGLVHFPTSSRKETVAFFCPGRKVSIGNDYLFHEVNENDGEAACLQTAGGKIYCSNIHEVKFDPYSVLSVLWGQRPVEGYGSQTGRLCDEWLGKMGAESQWYVKLLIGLGMYWNAFPEAVRVGVPHDLKHPAMHDHGTQMTVEVSEKIRSGITEGHASPTAHFRVGHFRVLKSERYTAKRFQTIFVRETFVNGQCKTVLSPEEVEAAA